tara:strand:+ start:460 stop:1176 length:717 start_codon:yes stop_codon:yes gene_type:complete
MSTFWKETVPEGYYDKAFIQGLDSGRSIQACWHKITFKNVKKHISKNSVILDYACGSGNFFGTFEKLNNSVGVDISQKQINYANKEHPDKANFYTTEYFDPNSFQESFDVITCLGLIEFIEIEEIEDLLSTFYKMLKPGGKVILTTPNFQITMKLLEKILNKFGNVNYRNEYKNRFIQKQLERLFLNSNFNLISIKKIISPFVFLSLISNKLALNLNYSFEKIFQGKLGFLFIIVLEK